MRRAIEGQSLTVTEIAMLTGLYWRVLDPADRERREVQANVARQKYHRELVQYQQTVDYSNYCEYVQKHKEQQCQ